MPLQFTGDPFIWIPNCVGFLLGCLQLALCVIYPRDARYFKALPPCALPAPLLSLCLPEGTGHTVLIARRDGGQAC